LSDFGLTDEFVGVVHGVLLRVAPDLRIIDLTHQIPRGDVRAGALALLRAVQYVPPGVVLAVVDPGVGTARRALAVETPWGYFVGPDNGLLAPAVAMVGGASRMVSIEDPGFRLPAAGSTFDGRDVFAPAAAALASRQARLEDLGPVVAPDDVTPLLFPLAEGEGDMVRAEAWWIDAYGNVQSNASPEDLAGIGLEPGDTAIVQVGATSHEVPFAGSYGAVGPGEPVLHVDSHGLVALAVREGRADAMLSIATGMALVFRALPSES